jgi:hypothetical protein
VTIEALEAGFEADFSNPQVQAAFAVFSAAPEVVALNKTFAPDALQAVVVHDLVHMYIPSQEDASFSAVLVENGVLLAAEHYVFDLQEDALFGKNLLRSGSVFVRDISTYDPANPAQLQSLSTQLLRVREDPLFADLDLQTTSISTQSGSCEYANGSSLVATTICSDQQRELRTAQWALARSHLNFAGYAVVAAACFIESGKIVALPGGGLVFKACITGASIFLVDAAIGLGMQWREVNRLERELRDCQSETLTYLNQASIVVIATMQAPLPLSNQRIIKDGFFGTTLGTARVDDSITGNFDSLERAAPLAVAVVPPEYLFTLNELDIDPSGEVVRLTIYRCGDPSDFDDDVN